MAAECLQLSAPVHEIPNHSISFIGYTVDQSGFKAILLGGATEVGYFRIDIGIRRRTDPDPKHRG
jgi:hypothetical protein